MRNLILGSFILCAALGQPRQEPTRPRPSCIRMTPEKEEQIDSIVEKLSDFLSNLTLEHEHFDIRLIKLAIEQHTADEPEDKETVLQLSVNDCQLSHDEVGEIEQLKEKAKQHELEREANAEAESDRTNEGKNFNVMYLDLGENGKKLLEAIDKKKKGPKLVYVQKDAGQLDYMFFTKK